jgi:hypothetical protein
MGWALLILVLLTVLASCGKSTPSISTDSTQAVGSASSAGSTVVPQGTPTTFGATTTTFPDGVFIVPQLRIVNSGFGDITGLVVHFPESALDFGNVPAGGATEYRDALGGVYRWAGYSYLVDGTVVTQRVTDWVGERPIAGIKFTYRIALEPWRKIGSQIRLVEVTVGGP